MKRYEDRCRNYVTFRPGPALFTELKKQMENAGFQVGDSVSPDAPGSVKFQVSNGTLTVSGWVLCENDIATVKRILASQVWLSPEWNGNSMRAVTDLTVADTQLDVGIVFVGVTRTQLERLGNSSADGTVLSWNLIAWFRALAGGAPDSLAGTSGEIIETGSLIASAMGISLDQLSQKLYDAGVSTEMLNSIGSSNLMAMAASCGGSLEQLTWMIQNYNNVPIIDKNGNVTTDTTQPPRPNCPRSQTASRMHPASGAATENPNCVTQESSRAAR